MKILSLTTLFPNQQQPIHAIFVKNRIAAVNEICEVKIVAPVPLAFPFKLFSEKYKMFSRIPAMEIQDGMEVFHPRYLVTPKVGRSLYGFMYFFSILGFVKRLRNTYDFDLLDIHWAYPDGFAGVLLGKLLKKPTTLTVRGSDINEYSKSPMRRRLIAYALKRASKVIAVCGDMGQKVHGLGVDESKITVIPNGVDTDKFYPLERNDARKRLNLPQESKIILSVGRLAYPKRFDHIIEAMDILIKAGNHDKLMLVIVGNGEYYGNLRKMVETLDLDKNVTLVGEKSNDELIHWYNAADIFCLASSSEGWPNVIFESLACGTPVVAYSVGGVPEVIHSRDYGVLVERQDPKLLAESLHEALSKEWNINKILEYSHTNTWSTVAHKVYSTFQTVIEETR